MVEIGFMRQADRSRRSRDSRNVIIYFSLRFAGIWFYRVATFSEFHFPWPQKIFHDFLIWHFSRNWDHHEVKLIVVHSYFRTNCQNSMTFSLLSSFFLKFPDHFNPFSFSCANRVDPYHSGSDPKQIWTYLILCKRSLYFNWKVLPTWVEFLHYFTHTK